MANSTPTQFQQFGAGYQKDYISDFQRRALLVHALLIILKGHGGTNYIGNLGQLVLDASVATSGLLDADLEVDFYGVMGKWANTLDAVNYPATSNAALQLIPTQVIRDKIMMHREILFLVDLIRQAVN